MNYTKVFFYLTFFLNFFIMGLTRYITIPLPITVLMEVIWYMLLFLILTKRELYIDNKELSYAPLLIFSIWAFYGLFEIINDTCKLGIDIVGWYKEYRPYCIYPMVVMLIYLLFFNTKADLKKYIDIWGICILIMTLKCIYQKYIGFDMAEKAWLAAGGERTHIIQWGTLIRYWSYFTDAANMGCHTAISALVFGFTWLTIPIKQKKRKILYTLFTLGAIYCMFMSGTRTAIVVFLCGIFAFAFLVKNWKLFGVTTAGLIALVFILVFTGRGNGIDAVRRMRTAFNKDDASLQVRYTNQDVARSYMADAPFGIGFGKDAETVPQTNYFYYVATIAPDSTLVYLWYRTGPIGITLFMIMSILLLIGCAKNIWFHIRDGELRTLCAAFTAAAASWLVAGYANNIYHQFPNLMMVYGMIAIVYLAPWMDKCITEEKEKQQKQLKNHVPDETTA